MIKFNKFRQPLQPVTREDLIDEVIRLQGLIVDTIKHLNQKSRREAEVLKLGLHRDKEYHQPNVGKGSQRGHYLDTPILERKDA